MRVVIQPHVYFSKSENRLKFQIRVELQSDLGGVQYSTPMMSFDNPNEFEDTCRDLKIENLVNEFE